MADTVHQFLPRSQAAGKGSAITRKTVLLQACARGALVLAVLWLAFKDGLISDAPAYPYAASLAVTLAVVAGTWGASSVRRLDRWRDFVVCLSAVFTLICLVHFSFSSWLVAHGVLPSAAFLALAFGLAGAWSLKADSEGRARRAGYSIATLVGLIGLLLQPHINGYSPALGIASILIAMGIVFLVRYGASRTGQKENGRHLLLVPYVLSLLLYGYWLFELRREPGIAGMLLGHGLTSNTQNLVSEQGLISGVLLGVLLLAALVYNAMSLDEDPKEQTPAGSNMQSGRQEQVVLSVGAMTTLLAQLGYFTIAPAFAMSASFLGAWWVLVICIASLCIAARVSREATSVSASSRRLQRVKAGMAALLVAILVIWLSSLFVLSRSLPRTGAPRGASAFVPISSMPTTVLQAAGTGRSTTSWSDLHATVRSAFGAPVHPQPSMAMQLAARALGPGVSSTAFGHVSIPVLAALFSSRFSGRRIEELYLNTRDYGVPGSQQGLTAAADYFFHKPLANLSGWEASFLVTPQPPIDGPVFRFEQSPATPQFVAIQAARFHYQELKLPAGGTSVEHEGALNDSGQEVFTLETGQVGPFVWQKVDLMLWTVEG